jgi:2-keto-4-pentenoate hydratase/2-oxohepta-3-ene-1,7-dioic acid hydratase in catechol pathway
MKFASYDVSGRPLFGVVVGEQVFDLNEVLASDDLRMALRNGALAAFVRSSKTESLPVRDLATLRLLPVLPHPGRLLCIGRNYADHAAEMKTPPPLHPSVFLRTPESLVAPGAPLIRPTVSEAFDFEGELAVIIGTAGRDIPMTRAMEHVFGYSCFNDGSVRDFQFEHSLTAGKNFDGTGSFGPYLVSADEVGDPRRLTLQTLVNGREMQHAQISDLLFNIPFLISYLSRVMKLEPGDVIATGTPSGAGFSRKPPVWLRPGDTVEVSISGVGVLRNSVAQRELED